MLGTTATVWADTSFLALDMAVEVDSEVIEDACCLRSDMCYHKNMGEMGTVLKGLNLDVVWGMTLIRLMTDSFTVHHFGHTD